MIKGIGQNVLGDQEINLLKNNIQNVFKNRKKIYFGNGGTTILKEISLIKFSVNQSVSFGKC